MPDLTRAMHVVIDKQRIFAEHPDWAVKDIGRIRPEVTWLAEHKPGRTFWTRFVPAQTAGSAVGAWRKYYELWPTATLDGGGADYVDLLPERRTLAGKGCIFGKGALSAFGNEAFGAALQTAG